MSGGVDSRVVQMRFENGQFESGVRTSMGTIEKLKQALNFNGVGKGFSNISSAAKSCNLNPLGSAVESVGLKFSALQVMATTALANITNSAVNAGKRIVSAITIDPIKSGFQEYETQINAIQTVLANTESKGTTLGDVNSALDELNKYADKTIYNFTEMTRNIGTFTAAGVDLETSVSSIKGIANLAAVSGSTSQQASTAMYQLSQALASGTVKLMDWNSVVNAGMGGEVFQTALKRTAANMGVNVDAMIEKYGSFRETLTQGEWLTADVLTETLSQLAGAYSEADLLAKGYTQEQTDQILKLAKTGEDAATKVKTFTQLIDTTKEALQSGWTQTWENIVGDFESAKSLWSDVGDLLSETIGASADRRNAFIGEAMKSNWDRLIESVNEAGIETADFEQQVRASAESIGYEGDKIDQLVSHYGSLGEAFKAGAISSLALKKAMKELTTTSVDLSLITGELKKGDTGDDVRQAQKALKSLGYDIGTFGEGLDGLDGKLGKVTESAIQAFQESQGLKVTGIVDEATLAALDKANAKTTTLTGNIDEYISGIKELGGQDLLHDALKNVLTAVLDVTNTIGEAWRNIFDFKPEGLYNAIKSFNEFSQSLEMSETTADNLRRTFEGVFAILDIVATLTGSTLKYAFEGLSAILSVFDLDILGFTGNIGDAIVALRDWIDAHDVVGMAIEKAGQAIGFAIKTVSGWIEEIRQIPEVQAALAKFGESIAGVFDNIKGRFSDFGANVSAFIERVKAMDSISLDDIKNVFTDLKENVLKPFFNFDFDFSGIKDSLSTLKDKLTSNLEGLGEVFDWVKEKGAQLVEFFKGALPAAIAVAIGAMTAIGVFKLGGVLENLMSPLEFLDDLGDSIEKFADAAKIRAIGDSIQSIGTAILMVAGAVALLANIENQGAVWSAVGAIAVLMAAMAGFAFLISKIPLHDAAKLMGLSVSVLALAAGLAVLVLAIKMLEEMDVNLALKNGGILLGLVVLMGAIAAALNTFGAGVSKGAAGLLLVALALAAFVLVLKGMANVELDTILNALPTFLLIMGGVVALLMATSTAGKYAIGAGVAILAISLAIQLMVSAFKRLGEMNPEEVINALPGFIAIIAGISALIIATALAGQHAMKAGAAILMVSGALLLIVTAIKQMSTIDEAGLEHAKTVVTAVLGVFAVIIATSYFAGEHAVKAGLMLLLMSGALMILVGAIAILQRLAKADTDSLDHAVGVILVLEAMFGALIAVSRLAGEGIKTLVMLTVAVAVLVGLVSAITLLDDKELELATKSLMGIMGVFSLLILSTKFLSGIKLGKSLVALAGLTLVVAGLANILSIMCESDTKGAIEAAESLSILLIALAAACLLVSFAGSSAAAAIGPMAALVLVVAGLAAVLALLTALDINASIETVGAIAVLLLSLSVACLLMAGVGAAGAAAWAGLAVLASLIAGMTGIVAGLAAIGDNVDWQKGIDALASIGEALGSFFGGIVAGFSTEATSALPAIGANISSFMGAIQPFITYSKSIDKGLIERIGILTGAILALTAADFIAGGSTLLGGGTDFKDLKSNLLAIGEGIAGFVDELADIDLEALKIGTEAVKAFAEMFAFMPKEGGLMQKILGTADMDEFAKGITSFGGAIMSFSESVSDLGPEDLDAMKNATEAGIKLAELEGNIPKKGGWAQDIMGSSELTTFGEGIAAFGAAIVGYANSVSKITPESLDAMKNATDAGVKLAELEGKIPESGGWAQDIMGAKDLATFGLSLNTFGKCLVEYADTVKDLDDGVAEKIELSAEAAEKLVLLADKLPKTDGLAQDVAGEQNMATFGKSLTDFAKGLTDVVNAASKLGDDAPKVVAKLGSVIDAIVPLLDKIPKSGGVGEAMFGSSDHGDFGQGLINLAKGITDYLKVASGIDDTTVDKINNTKAALEACIDAMMTVTDVTSSEDGNSLANAYFQMGELITMVAGLANSDFTGLTTLKEGLEGIGGDCISGFVEAFATAGEDAKTAVDTFMENVTTAVDAHGITFNTTGDTLATELSKGISESTAVSEAADTVASDAAEGIDTTAWSTAGANCVAGFAAGISENTFAATAAASAMASAALAAAEEALGINSPSKAFRKDGNFSGQGFILGLKDYQDRVYKAAYNIGEKAKGGLGNAISKVRNLLENGIDAQPTIRPVLDTSAVAAGVGTLNGMFGIHPSMATLANVRRLNANMAMSQNGGGNDVVSAINDLKRSIDGAPRNSYQINGITYDDGSNVSSAVETLIRAAKVERRK